MRAKVVQVTCQDCEGTFEYLHRTGCLPRRCVECRTALTVRQRRESYVRHAEKRRAAASAYWRAKHPRECETTCADCGQSFRYEQGRGGRRPFCDDCRIVRARKRGATFKLRHRDRILQTERTRIAAKRLADPGFKALEAERAREWRARNPERASEIRRDFYWRHAERKRAESAERRKAKRLAIYERDHGCCYLCGLPIAWEDFEVDHVIPVSKGGTSEPDNLKSTHRPCNRGKAARLLEAVAA